MIYAERNEKAIVKLHPRVAPKARELMELLAIRGLQCLITSSYRSFTEQQAIYDQGRTEPGQVVTNAKPGESLHNYALAFDFVPCDSKGVLNWNGDYKAIADVARPLGFEWGGDWKSFPDKPHLQMTFGLTLKDLQNGKTVPPAELLKPSFNAEAMRQSAKVAERRKKRMQ